MIDIIDLLQALVLGITVGISAAIIPGPMMFATIGISMKNGWRTGPWVFIGHALVETAIFLLILAGATAFLGESIMSGISIIGGLVMVLFGMVLIKSAKKVSTMDIVSSSSKKELSSGPVSTGVITSALNPSLVIWWLTAGSAIILQEYLLGISAVIVFILGHWLADLGFLVAVSSSFSRGKELFSPRTHERILYFCGAFMAVFGLWFLANYDNVSAFF
ncbi:LysE family transporter [Methanolobus mangrovi]|uniref:LysE family transporter n=1 Tax=Methanolobus mangrovi TaxID=3072977 RepID=A0AA51UG27_9EURY|nr:LysE family transporter [Methanolobus mangrovi]WMW22604.1 LysE family transporter [Methanolobus mangrovi]